MLRNRIKVMKSICFIFASAWVVHVITSFIKYYNDAINWTETTAFLTSIFGFWIGILVSLVISGGFSFVFWSAYRAKYKNEKIFDFISKKVIAFLLMVTIFRLAFGISIFKPALFFTLVLFIKYLEREQTELIADNNI